MSVSCILHTFLKYRDHYTFNIIVAAPMQRCNYYIHNQLVGTEVQTLGAEMCISMCIKMVAGWLNLVQVVLEGSLKCPLAK